MSTPIRVLLADDTDDLRAIVRTALNADRRFSIVGEARNGAEAVEMAAAARPDVVVLDLAMPVMDGFQAAPEIVALVPGCKIVILSGFDAAHMAERARAAGAHRYIEKGAAITALVDVLIEVCDGAAPAAAPARVEQERSAVARLRESDEFRRTLLSAVSHDIRNPLTSIQGFSETLRHNLDGLNRNEITDMLTRISANAERIERILRNLIDLERLEAGATLANLSQTDVAAVAARVLAAVDVRHRERVSIEGDQVEAIADPGLLERALDNLVTNGLRHTPEGTPVWIRIGREAKRVHIQVEDAGAGIPLGMREVIFEPFRRAPSRRPGNGLGLSIVRRFIELMGGTITVSDRRGGGASFVVTLPSAVERAESA